MVSNLTAEYDG